MATPAICGSQIFHRVSNSASDGSMQEVLYCLETQKSSE
jgi:hypothetical protein